MNLREVIKPAPDAIRVAAFGLVFMGSLLMINRYLPVYLVNNPPVCREQGVVQEIIALEGNKAKIKLLDGTIRIIAIKNYNNEKEVFKNQIDINQTVCLEYENMIVYKLYKTIGNYNFR